MCHLVQSLWAQEVFVLEFLAEGKAAKAKEFDVLVVPMIALKFSSQLLVNSHHL